MEQYIGKIICIILIVLAIYMVIGRSTILKWFIKNPNKLCKLKIHNYEYLKDVDIGFTIVSGGIYKCTNCGRTEEIRQFASSESDPYVIEHKKGKFEKQ